MYQQVMKHFIPEWKWKEIDVEPFDQYELSETFGYMDMDSMSWKRKQEEWF